MMNCSFSEFFWPFLIGTILGQFLVGAIIAFMESLVKE